MRKPFERMSIAAKLKCLILAVCGVTLIGASLGYMISDFLAYRRSAVDHLKVVARVLGTNVSAALLFHDPLTARHMLASLKNEPDIHRAALFDKSGTRLAYYQRADANPPPAVFGEPGCVARRADLMPDHAFEGQLLKFYSPVIHDGEYIGCLSIRSGLDGLHARFRRNVRIMLGVLALALGIAYALSTRLQGLISRPIIALSEIMNQVSAENRFELRAPETTRTDEIGMLITGFNQMLAQIEERDRRLARHQEILESQVAERTAALQTANSVLQEAVEAAEGASQAKSEAIRELQSTQAQLVQAGKLASIGELAAGVAHELNQPLMVIRSGIQVTSRSLARGRITLAQVLDQMAIMEKNTTRMMRIINHLRTFSRQSPKAFSMVDLAETIDEAFMMTREQLQNRDIRIQAEIDPAIPRIRGNANQLEQVFLNLITNARDALTSGAPAAGRNGTLTVVARRLEDNGNRVEILFSDTGRGIPPEIQEKIFDPFFTTKEVGSGTGLGLSISYGIIRDHGGTIEIARSAEDGTTFRITLPVDAPEPLTQTGEIHD